MVKVHNKFFDNHFDLSKVIRDMDHRWYTKDKIDNNFHWGSGVTDFSKPISLHTIRKDNPIYSIISNRCNELLNERPANMIYCWWPPGSYIPWHNDHNKDGTRIMATTIYLNENWNNTNGGLFQYIQDDNVYSVKPELNTAVSISTGIEHSTTILSSKVKVRKSIQCWYYKK